MYPRTVLVVDDEPLIRMVLAQSLEDEGYDVLEASNVLEAVAVFARHHVDAIITDVDMPGALNGFDLANLVAMTGHGAAIVITSGRHRAGDREMPEGSLFLSKPYRMDDVLQALTTKLAPVPSAARSTIAC